MNTVEYASFLLKQGKLVAIPTETVYGLGADAKNPTAIKKIYQAKGRPTTHPLIIHLPNVEALPNWAIDIPDEAWLLAKAFWPGPLTLILKRHPHVPLLVTAGQETVALRIPNHPLALALLEHFAGGIAAPSANRYGRISPTRAEHVTEDLGEAVAYILEGGPCTVGIESTILSLVGSEPVILRPGSINAQSCANVLGKKILEKRDAQPSLQNRIIVPGSSLSHYAPVQPLYLLEKELLFKMALKNMEGNHITSVLSFTKCPSTYHSTLIHWIHAPRDPEHYAQQLYNSLRTLDKKNSVCILAECPPPKKEWGAIMDRLQRAAQASID